MTISNGKPFVEVQLDLEHIRILKDSLLLKIQDIANNASPHIPKMMDQLIRTWQIYQLLDAAWDSLLVREGLR